MYQPQYFQRFAGMSVGHQATLAFPFVADIFASKL
jgi:hypothetical protein